MAHRIVIVHQLALTMACFPLQCPVQQRPSEQVLRFDKLIASRYSRNLGKKEPCSSLFPSFPFSMADQQLQCRDCGQTFTFTEGEQQFYASKNLSAPQRCKDCRNARKSERMETRQMYPAVCAKCGAQCEVPFKPRPEAEGGKPVLCKECFAAQRAQMAA